MAYVEGFRTSAYWQRYWGSYALNDYSTNQGGLIFQYEPQAPDYVNCQTKVKYKLIAWGNYTMFSRYLKINGSIQYEVGVPYDSSSPTGTYVTAGQQITSGEFTIKHDKTTGEGSFTAEAGVCVQYTYWTMNWPYGNNTWDDTGNWNSKGSGSFALATIPRNAATITNVTISNSTYTHSGTNYVVAGYSDTTLNISTTLGDAPSISNYKVYYSTTFVYNVPSSTPTFKVPNLQFGTDSESISYKVIATDSYGMQTNTYNVSSFTAYKYTRGDATSDPLTQRCTSGGTLDEEGTYAKCVISFSKSKIGSTQITTTITATVNNKSGTSTTSPTAIITGNGTLSNNSSYTVSYKLSDVVTTTPVQIATDVVSVSFYTMHITADGKGLGFGQAATSGYYDIDNMEFRVNEGISTSANHGKMAVGFLSNDNQNHGLYSYGYINSSNQFVSDPKWMIKRDNTGEITIGGLGGTTQVYTSGKITKTGGHNLSSYSIAVWGKVVVLSLVIAGGSGVAYGGSVFKGQLTSDLYPASVAYSVGVWYEHQCRASVDTNGVIDVVNVETSTISYHDDTPVTIVYLLP